MLHELQNNQLENTTIWTIYVWFLRMMAAICLAVGLKYWAQMIGITNGGELRFDLVDQHWRIFATALAVVLPAAALGLWLTQAWGVVLWVVALAMEIAAFGIWTDLYSAKPLLVIAHLVSLGLLVILAIALFIQKKRLDAA